DGIAKVLRVTPVLEASARLDVPERVIPGLGVVLIAATLLYAFPTTSVLGAIVLTGYLGGATWTHVRMGGPVFPMVFPVLFGAWRVHPVARATSVRVRDGRRLVTDGPFAETREQLGGYFLVEAEDLDEAIAIAGRIPGARKGTVEIRPILEIEGLPSDA